MRLSIREEIMYQRKAYEMCEIIIDTVCAELEEERNVQELLHEMENYNSIIQAEQVSEDRHTLELPEAGQTTIVLETENEKIITKMVDDLERELEERDGQAREGKEQSSKEMNDADIMKDSCFGVARAKINETHKLRSILEDEKISKKEKCVEAEENIYDEGYCCLFESFGGYEEVEFSLKKLNQFTTEDSECHVKPDPLKKFYDLFDYRRPVDRDHKNTQHTNNVNNLNDDTMMVNVTSRASGNKPTTIVEMATVDIATTTVETATTTVEMATSTSMSKPTTKMTNSVYPESNCLPIPLYVIYGSLVISSISILVVIVIIIRCVFKKRTQKDDTYQTMGDRSRESIHYYDQVSPQLNLPIHTKKKREKTMFDRLLDAFRKNLQCEIVNEYDEVRFLNKPAAVSSNPPELPTKREVTVNLVDESDGDNYLEPIVTPTLRNKYKIRVEKQPITEEQKTLSISSCGLDSAVVQATVETRAIKGSLSGSSSVKPKKNAEVGKHLLTRSISLPRKSSVIVI